LPYEREKIFGKNFWIQASKSYVLIKRGLNISKEKFIRYLFLHQLRCQALPGLICNLLNIFCLQKCVLQLLGFQASKAQMEECAGDKPAPKPSWGCACKISSRSVQGLGFLLAFHIPTDIQKNICTPIFINLEDKRLHNVYEDIR